MGISWIFMRWRHWYFEYEVTLRKYSEADVMGILKFIFKIKRLLLNIQNTHDITLRIFKIPMSLWIFKIIQNICHIFKITLLLNIQNTHDITSRIFQNTHDVSFWIFPYSKYQWRQFMNIQNASWVIWIFECWRYGYFENSWSDVIGLLNTHEVTSWVIWVFMRWGQR